MSQLAWLLAQNGPVAPQTADQAEAAREISLAAFLERAAAYLQHQGLQFGLALLQALLVFWIGKWVAGIAVRILRRVLQRTRLDAMLVSFAANLLYALLLAFVVIAALAELGIQTTTLTAVVAATGFAVGLSLQGSLGNFASGLMLVTFRPFRIGDDVVAGGTAGIVEDIQIFSSVLRTPDNRRVIVPNGAITGATITNNSVNLTRRIDLTIGCGYDDDLRAVKAFLEGLLAADPRILAEPKPAVALAELAESSVNFLVQPWVNAGDYGAVKCGLLEQIKLGFDERGFSIPYPSRDVYVHQTAAASQKSEDSGQT
jgi:small conductance mechanosensitive channel